MVIFINFKNLVLFILQNVYAFGNAVAIIKLVNNFKL